MNNLSYAGYHPSSTVRARRESSSSSSLRESVRCWVPPTQARHFGGRTFGIPQILKCNDYCVYRLMTLTLVSLHALTHNQSKLTAHTRCDGKLGRHILHWYIFSCSDNEGRDWSLDEPVLSSWIPSELIWLQKNGLWLLNPMKSRICNFKMIFTFGRGHSQVEITRWFGNITTMEWWDNLYLNEGTLLYAKQFLGNLISILL